MSRWAKNASTTTIRIGKAALLKNLLMARWTAPPAPCGTRPTRGQAYQGAFGLRPGCAICRKAWPKPCQGCVRTRSSRGCPAPSRCSGRPLVHRQRGHVRQVAIALGVVEAVADREPVRDLEAGEADGELDLSPRRLRQQRAHLERRRVARAEVAHEVLQREARVDDVLDDQDVAALDRRVEVLEDPHDAARGGRRAVRRDGHEVALPRDRDAAPQVREEELRALEDADEQQVAVAVLGAHRVPERPHALLELVGLDEDLADGGVAHAARVYVRRAGSGGVPSQRRTPPSTTARAPEPRSSAPSPSARISPRRPGARAHRSPVAPSASRRTTSRASARGSAARCSTAIWSRPARAVSTTMSRTSASSRRSSAVRTTLRSAAGWTARSAGTRSPRTRPRAYTREAFVASSRHPRPRARHHSAVSSRVTPSSGRTSRPERAGIPSSARRPGLAARR